jgi:uncharacterized protein (DUF58 family)
MPTERAKITIFFLILSLVISFYTQVELIFFIAGILASILLVSFILFRITRVDQISCRRQIPAAAFEGQNVTVKIFAENKSPFSSFFVSIRDTFSPDPGIQQQKKLLFPFLARRAVIEGSYGGHCPKRGVYWVGPLELFMSDPLGFFQKKKVLNLPSKITVYPSSFPIIDLGQFNKGVVPPRYGSHTTRKSGDYEEFFGIREYHQEDGLRKIHWPSTARLNQLMVRHFEQTGAYSATLMLDLKYDNNLGQGKYSTLEYAVRIVASLAKYFFDQGFLVQLLAYGDQPIITSFGKDPSHYSYLLELLAQAQANSAINLAEAIGRLDHFIYPNSTLAIVRLDRDFAAVRAVEQLIYTKNMSVFDIQLVSATFDEKLGRTQSYFPDVKGSEVLTYSIACGDNLQYKFIRR